MSEPKLISPMLDEFVMGDPVSDHNGVRCCPAMKKDSNDKYIVKVLSIPASQTQLDALLLSGAYPDKESALTYFKELADGAVDEVQILERLSQLEGFLPYEDSQIVPMTDETGYDVYLLGTYKRSLERHFIRSPMTHLGAVNLGLDLCAALSVCRRSGYLYVDLKPSNIYVTGDKEYRIGDLGFVRLDSLKYASLPDRYRSRYTAPEISDAFAALNPAIDIYAAGLILYQAYNNGELPFSGDTAPDETFPAPMYADYEMSEIILKACAPNPDDRWQDPIQMGQALVSYMQRNGANDTPIVPPPAPEPKAEALPESNGSAPEEIAVETLDEQIPVLQDMQESSDDESDESLIEPETKSLPEEEAERIDEVLAEENAEPIEEVPAEEETGLEAEALIYSEDDFGNLNFLMDMSEDETAPENVETDIDYDQVSEEVSQMLAQADDLASHQVPDPVIPPEPIDIPMPEPIPVASAEAEPEIPEDESSEDADTSEDIADTPKDDASTDESEDNENSRQEDTPKKHHRHWLRNTLIVFAVLGLLAGAAYYYTSYYLQPIESIKVDGSEDTLTVYITSNIDETLLTVVCSDAYGNQLISPVVDGKAAFTNLVSNTGYTVNVKIDGFHRLTGNTSIGYSTPVQTNIVQFNAVTGSEDGSVILSFTVEGPDSDQWMVVYSAEGEEELAASFPSHMVTLTGLTVGKEYTFRLVPDQELYIVDGTQMTYTPSNLVAPENLKVNSCADGTLTASWTAPEGVAVDSWTVRCYNGSNYNETITVTETAAVFEGVNVSDSFTVEVTAAGMSVGQRVYVSENSVTITDFQVDSSDLTKIVLSWNSSLGIPDGGWILKYTVNGSDASGSITCQENSAVLNSFVSGGEYNFELQRPDGSTVLGGSFTYTAPTVSVDHE